MVQIQNVADKGRVETSAPLNVEWLVEAFESKVRLDPPGKLGEILLDLTWEDEPTVTTSNPADEAKRIK